MVDKRISIISHCSIDILEDTAQLGGPVSYGGTLLKNLGANFIVYPMFGKDFIFKDYYNTKIEKFFPINSKKTTTFKMKFLLGKRNILTMEKGDSFNLNLLPKSAFEADFIHLSPIVNDMPINFLKKFRSISKGLIAIDPFNNDSGKFTKKELSYFKKITKVIDIIKLSENELFGMLKTKSIKESIKYLKKYPNLFLITRGAKGTTIYKRGFLYKNIPTIKINKVLDSTGCGDIFLTGFMYGLSKNYNIEKSTLLGNICASLSTKFKGPSSAPSKKNILSVLRNIDKKNKSSNI